MKYLMKRVKEPSTWAGLSALIFGIGTVAKADGMPEIAGVVENVGNIVTAGGGSTDALLSGGVAFLAGVASIFMGEKDK